MSAGGECRERGHGNEAQMDARLVKALAAVRETAKADAKKMEGKKTGLVKTIRGK